MLARCTRLDLDCADICDATGRILSRKTATESQMPCVSLQACAEECENHTGHHEHCRICVERCRRCQTACNNVLSEMGA